MIWSSCWGGAAIMMLPFLGRCGILTESATVLSIEDRRQSVIAMPTLGIPRCMTRAPAAENCRCVMKEGCLMDKKKHVTEILKRLRKEHAGTPQTALNFSTAFELLVATILSAQTTDVQVNKVTEKLFKKYRTIEDFANTAPDKLEKDVASVNFYRNKARNISNAAKMIIEQFGGKVPETMEELISLPGVARKTANIVLSSAYGINEGIAVDTHVKR